MLLGRGRPEGGACVRLVRHISDESGDPPGAAGTAAKILRPPVERRGRTVPHRQGAIEFLMCQRELAVNVDSSQTGRLVQRAERLIRIGCSRGVDGLTRSEEHTSEL